MCFGLKRGTVLVEPHKELWEIKAQEMIAKLKSILKDDIVDAQHIGSTSIKNISAKPIIDIAVGVINNEFEKKVSDKQSYIYWKITDHLRSA